MLVGTRGELVNRMELTLLRPKINQQNKPKGIQILEGLSIMQPYKCKRGFALMGRNSTGPPCSVGARWPASPPAALQTPASKTILAH